MRSRCKKEHLPDCAKETSKTIAPEREVSRERKDCSAADNLALHLCELHIRSHLRHTGWHIVAKHLAKQVNTQSLVVEELAAVTFRPTVSAIPSSDPSRDTSISNKPPTATCMKSNQTRHLCCDVQGHIHMPTFTLATYYALSQNSTLKAGSIVIVWL